MTHTPLITIISINFNCLESLIDTILSVDEQVFKGYFHVVVASSPIPNFYDEILGLHESANRKFIINSDNSIYNAMNIGLLSSRGRYVMFLNSGDTFVHTNSLISFNSDSASDVKGSTCYSYASIQYNKHDYYLRPCRQQRRGIFFYPHQSFICPLNSLTPIFDEARLIDADQLWMRDAVKTFSVKLFQTPLSFFELGGLSNLPSPKSLRSYVLSKMWSSALIEFCKLLIFSCLGSRYYYMLFQGLAGFKRIRSPHYSCYHIS